MKVMQSGISNKAITWEEKLVLLFLSKRAIAGQPRMTRFSAGIQADSVLGYVLRKSEIL